MDYKRRKRRRRQTRHTSVRGDGTALRLVLALMAIGLVVYIASATAAGDWVSQNVFAPIFKGAATKASPSPGGTDTKTGEVTLAGKTSYVLQMGIFSTTENANEQAKKITKQGAAGYVYQDGDMFRVLAMGYETRDEAENVKKRLNEEDVECAVREITANEVKFDISGSALHINEISACFEGLIGAQSSMAKLCLESDKESYTIERCVEEAKEIRDELKKNAETLAGQNSESNVISEVEACYESFIDAISEICDGKIKTAVDLSAKMKYNHIYMIHEYAALTAKLGSAG